jgi:hypothetical protein
VAIIQIIFYSLMLETKLISYTVHADGAEARSACVLASMIDGIGLVAPVRLLQRRSSSPHDLGDNI